MTYQRHLVLVFVLLLFIGSFAPAARAQGTDLPTNFSEFLVADSIVQPTTMAFAPDGRLFVSQKTGELRIIENGVLLPTPFMTLDVDTAGERGLLGVAFDPDFTTNHFLYVYYTVPAPLHNRVSRFTANGDVVVQGSEDILLDLNPLVNDYHNGGSLHFGADGKLYIGVGENGTRDNAQDMTNLLGKMLRINSDGSIPTDNPFYGTTTGQNKAIWAKGLRNPYTFAFQPGSGRLFINDVGESTYEEINDGIAGSNYGWPDSEGPDNLMAGFRGPLFYYRHTIGCAITGGVFYNPVTDQFPADFVGKYFFSDYCGSWIHLYTPDATTNPVQNFADNTASNIVDLDLDNNGSLYYLAQQGNGSNGAVYRISYACPVTSSSAPGEAPPRNYFTTSTPTLTWNRVPGALGYHVQVATSTDFKYPDFQNDQIPADTLFATTTELRDCSYYWRVQAILPAGKVSGWSTTDTFVVDAVP